MEKIAQWRAVRAQSGEEIARFFPFIVDRMSGAIILQAGDPNSTNCGLAVEILSQTSAVRGEVVMQKALLAFAVALIFNSQCFAALLTPLTSFGGTDGWRAPNEVVTGDLAGTATSGQYNFLKTTSLERGIGYNPVTGNIYIASRSTSGQGVRILSGTTGADIGVLANSGTGTVTGGLITMVKVGAADDGAIYVDNAVSNVGTSSPGLKIYKWASEGAAAPTLFFNGNVAGMPGTPRVGDTMDVDGSGANTRIALGNQGGGTVPSGGYVIIDATATATAVSSFSPTAITNQTFNRGITFAGTVNDVWGRGQDQVALKETTYTLGSSVGGNSAAGPTFATAQQPIDYINIQGVPYLAVLDLVTTGTSSSSFGPIVRIYDMTTPLTPVLVATGSTVPNGTSLTNAAGLGQIVWGGSSVSGPDLVTTLYAMATNQGIQAFQFSVPLAAVPEAGAFAAVGLVGLLSAGAVWIRKWVGRATV